MMRDPFENQGRMPTVAEVDAAVRALWRGSAREIDALIVAMDGEGPSVGEWLLAAIAAFESFGAIRSQAAAVRRSRGDPAN